jgi:hypothetical protein
MKPSLIALVLLLVFMLLAQFGALAVPFVVWIIWLAVGIVLVATGH